MSELRENNFEFLAQYNKNITDDISLAVNFGANTRQQSYHNNTMGTVGGLSVPNFFNVNASVDRPSITDFKSTKTVNSIYGSASIAGAIPVSRSSTIPLNPVSK